MVVLNLARVHMRPSAPLHASKGLVLLDSSWLALRFFVSHNKLGSDPSSTRLEDEDVAAILQHLPPSLRRLSLDVSSTESTGRGFRMLTA